MPDRTEAIRRLTIANNARADRAAFLAEMRRQAPRRGACTAIDAITNPTRTTGGIALADIARAIRSIGARSVQMMLLTVGVPGETKIRDLSPHDAAVAAQWIDKRTAHRAERGNTCHAKPT